MAQPHVNRALLFAHPDMNLGIASGLQPNIHGGVATVEGLEAVRQAIWLLISTKPGERVMRPDYGCELYRVVFMNNNVTTAGLAIHYLLVALLRWEPRIEILMLDANPNPEISELLDITLAFRVKRTQEQDRLNFSLSLTGGFADAASLAQAR